MITVDYYEDNNFVVRIGDKGFVLDVNQSSKRANSTLLTEKNGLIWKTAFTKKPLTVGQLLNHLMLMKLKDFKQASYNGTNFSKELYLVFQNEFVNEE